MVKYWRSLNLRFAALADSSGGESWKERVHHLDLKTEPMKNAQQSIAGGSPFFGEQNLDPLDEYLKQPPTTEKKDDRKK
jgi:hypothetical protein